MQRGVPVTVPKERSDDANESEGVWLWSLKRIAAIAATGEHYAALDGDAKRFDAERYEELRSLAALLIGELANAAPAAVLATLPEPGAGYTTPMVYVRAAVLDGDEVLLVRERSDGRWTLPGGFADTGATAARNAEREVFEEAGIEVRAERLYAVVHKAAHDYDADVREFYKLYFLCRRVPGDDSAPRPCAVETLDARFFPRDALPDLSTGRVIAEHLLWAFDYAADPARPCYFE